MRTLKRSICLVLSLVMLLGLCTVFVSADGGASNLDKYTDKDKIQYGEAVDVLSGIGVLQGDAAGFRPKDPINRAEAAKIIAYLLIGNAEAADALKASVQTFTDVDKDWWAAGYIAYCAERGIVNGKGNNMYDPLAKVTGIEFAGRSTNRRLGQAAQKSSEEVSWRHLHRAAAFRHAECPPGGNRPLGQ